jgi:hypothetical protein
MSGTGRLAHQNKGPAMSVQLTIAEVQILKQDFLTIINSIGDNPPKEVESAAQRIATFVEKLMGMRLEIKF